MLKDIAKLLTGAFATPAPTKFERKMSPMFQRQSQTGNMDVDFIHSCVNSAQSGDLAPLLALYRDMESSDPVIQSAISTRKLAVLARGWNIVPAANSGQRGQQVADEVAAMIERSETFLDACGWLLHGFVWPAAVANVRWVPGAEGFSHPEFRNVPLELFDFTERVLRIKDTDANGMPLGTTHALDSRYIVHRGHMLTAPDNWGGPLRALLFWFLFSLQDREWWARFLERFGSPFLVGYYDPNDDDSRISLVNAFSEATRLWGIVATKETQVELKEAASTSSGSQFKDFYEVAKREKLLLILGQTLSGDAQSTGLGSGVAGLQGEVRADVRLWDALKLSKCIKRDVIKPWLRINGYEDAPPDIIFGGFDPALLAGLAPFLESLGKVGLDLDDDGLTILSRHVGMNLVRKAAPVAPEPMENPFMALMAALTPSVQANESIARAGAARLSRAFSGDLAPLGVIVRESRSPSELQARAGAFLATYRPGRGAEFMAEALNAHAANALLVGGPDPGGAS